VRHKYVRFVVPAIDEGSGRRQGVFHAAWDLMDARTLSTFEHEELQAVWNWFRCHLRVPNRFARSSRRRAAHRAICWYKSGARWHVQRTRWMCRILNDNGVATEMITCGRPGYIVFEDEHQVAAIPFAEIAT
jgi:hypothetical protein